MFPMRLGLSLPSILALACTVGFADIAPTRFVGSGISPIGETHVRMESAEVTIVWGNPSVLTAKFTMVNESTESKSLEVGFPMPIPRPPWSRPDPPDPLSIAFNGTATQVAGPFEMERVSFVSRWDWYRCTNDFAPGVTEVDVRTVLRASGGSGPYTQSLDYCIRTGGKWAGRIGSERVTIQFPWPVVEGQVRSIRPEGARIEGGRMSWSFSDIEPEQGEFDIHLAFIQPVGGEV